MKRVMRKVAILGVALFIFAILHISDDRSLRKTAFIEVVSEIQPKTMAGIPVSGTMITSWYDRCFGTCETANGEWFDKFALAAAHKKLPFGTRLLLVNPENRRWVTVSVNDRGPYWEDRELDITFGAARALDMEDDGVVELIYHVIDPDNKIKPPKVVLAD